MRRRPDIPQASAAPARLPGSHARRGPHAQRIVSARRAVQGLRGFTLIEMLVTITIAAILLSLGVPSFREVIRSTRTATLANDLVGAMNLARSEAVRRGQAVTVCGSADQATCNGDWLAGWIVVTAGNPLRVWEAPPPGAQIVGPGTASNEVTFQALGGLDPTELAGVGINEVSFRVRLADCTGTQARTVQVSVMGRINTRPNEDCT